MTAGTHPVATDETPTPRKRRTDLLGLVFVLVAVVVAGFALRDKLPEILTGLARVQWWRLSTSLALVVVGFLATAEAWRHSLAALGAPVSSKVARRIFFPAQVGKYLPGAVWPFIAQVRLAHRYGVRATTAVPAMTLFLAVHLVTAIVVAAGLLIVQPELVDRMGWGWLVLLLTLPLLHPRVVTLIMRRIGRSRDGIEPPRLTWSTVVRPLLWMLPAWLGYGAAVLVLAAPFTDMSWTSLWPLCASTFALSWMIGVAVVVVPAGVGAREAVLLLVLGPVLGIAAAASVGLLLRVCHTVADVLLAVTHGVHRVNNRATTERVT